MRTLGTPPTQVQTVQPMLPAQPIPVVLAPPEPTLPPKLPTPAELFGYILVRQGFDPADAMAYEQAIGLLLFTPASSASLQLFDELPLEGKHPTVAAMDSSICQPIEAAYFKWAKALLPPIIGGFDLEGSALNRACWEQADALREAATIFDTIARVNAAAWLESSGLHSSLIRRMLLRTVLRVEALAGWMAAHREELEARLAASPVAATPASLALRAYYDILLSEGLKPEAWMEVGVYAEYTAAQATLQATLQAAPQAAGSAFASDEPYPDWPVSNAQAAAQVQDAYASIPDVDFLQ